MMIIIASRSLAAQRMKGATWSRAEKNGVSSELDISDWEATDHIRRGKKVDKPSAPGGRFVRQVRSREKGLLILYPLLPHDGRAEKEDTPILGFSISFPTLRDDGGDTTVTYVVSNIYQQLEMDFDV